MKSPRNPVLLNVSKELKTIKGKSGAQENRALEIDLWLYDFKDACLYVNKYIFPIPHDHSNMQESKNV